MKTDVKVLSKMLANWGRAPARESMWAPAPWGAARGDHGGAAAAPDVGGGGLYGEESGERTSGRFRASCSGAAPAAVRTARRSCSKCTSALSTAMHLWLKPRPR